MSKKNVLAAAGEKRVSIKDTVTMNTTSNAIGGVLDNLRNHLELLQQEIKADLKGKKEYEDQLGKLQRRKADLMRRTEENQQFANQFDVDVGPFEQRYVQMTGEMSGLYENAKTEHQKGLQLLIDEFSYHPAFKRYRDSFSAVPFKPK